MNYAGSRRKTAATYPEHEASCDHFIIRVKEHLSPDWSKWFEGLMVTYTEAGETVLSGIIPDQAALHGLLARIRDLNLTLISVSRAELPEEKSVDKQLNSKEEEQR
jgi:hypothetical protein